MGYVALVEQHGGTPKSRSSRPRRAGDQTSQELRALRRQVRALRAELTVADRQGTADRPLARVAEDDLGPVHHDTLASAWARGSDAPRERLLLGRPDDEVVEECLHRRSALSARGVTIKILCPSALRSNLRLLKRIRPLLDGGAEVRTTSAPIPSLIVLDDQAALIPSWVEIHSSALVTYLDELLTAVWERSNRLGTERIAGATAQEVQLAVARLLVAGHIDEVIARKLGMSVRACRAHIATLSGVLGATSRAQLGFRIAASGLLEEPRRFGAPPAP